MPPRRPRSPSRPRPSRRRCPSATEPPPRTASRSSRLCRLAPVAAACGAPDAPATAPRRACRPRSPPRRAGIGDDFLKSFDDDLAPRAGPSRPAAPTFSAKARTSVANSIAAQAQRCADRQPYLGEGADQLKVQVRLSFARSGRLARPPAIGAHRRRFGPPRPLWRSARRPGAAHLRRVRSIPACPPTSTTPTMAAGRNHAYTTG